MQNQGDKKTTGRNGAAHWLAGLGDWIESPPPPSFLPPPPPLPEGAPGTPTYRLVMAQDTARANQAFRPSGQPRQEKTFCNHAACFIARQTGIPLGPLTDSQGVPLLANQQAANLAVKGSGYHQVSPADAQALADKGMTVLAVQPHAKHGHIATVRPDNTYFAPYEVRDLRGTGPVINQIGNHIGVFHESGAFLPHTPVKYYAPDHPGEPAR